MAKFTIPYGKKELTFSLPDSRQVTLLSPVEVPAVAKPEQLVNQALDQPAGGKKLADFSGARSVAIAINDKTRPVPHQHLLPPLLARLEALGLPPQAITLLIATGTHPPMPRAEFEWILPAEILNRYPVVCHNAYDSDSLVHLGQTARDTPVWINRRFAQADLRIVVGNLEPHQFVGFSGGVKSAVIGLGGPQTINHNHAMMSEPQARLGQFADNPVRQDIEEMGQMVGIHFALNAILNEQKKIVEVVAGDPAAVMAHGIPRIRNLYQIRVPKPFDLLIVSPGGHPKDINLYQAQKGLAHATLVTREEGTVILAAACPEGTGSQKYEQWMQDKDSHQAVFEAFQQEGFRIGPHKAFQLARDASRVQVLLVSEMEAAFVQNLLLKPAANLDQALSVALADLPPEARIGVMPLANATIAVLA
jgi:nickel-dependent lactate racemase